MIVTSSLARPFSTSWKRSRLVA